ncbi:MAG: hypothetical protein A2086_04865 [Spirochaetes bacterium GWD1_27_9]|nr:MAG: hypothetical protein A2Z98_04280 [Spirochaetes bacterium GWB1_27_13]OHD27637.1 MAG: hypothetical protein A2Y34_00320 [Spirochaetes bacterium GWC1_27_15]OHD31947.1 MAG: hypothetical protein A2086_04865 [Spirochaetes bacterium GWD1_27_9]
MDRKKALVVDDMEINRNVIKSFLYFEKFDVDLAEDGIKGLDLLSKNKYDLVFSDIEMPNMNGMELLTRAKKNPTTKNIPIVMLTSLDKQEIIDKAKELGASGYIVKPFTKEKMETLLKNIGF